MVRAPLLRGSIMAKTKEEQQKILREKGFCIVVLTESPNWVHLGRLEADADYFENYQYTLHHAHNVRVYREEGVIGLAENGPEKAKIDGTGKVSIKLHELRKSHHYELSWKWWDFLEGFIND